MPIEDAFSRLEEALQGAVERMQEIERENASLRQQTGQLKRELEGLRENDQRKRQLLEQFASDRTQIRSRVAKALDKIAGLEGSS